MLNVESNCKIYLGKLGEFIKNWKFTIGKDSTTNTIRCHVTDSSGNAIKSFDVSELNTQRLSKILRELYAKLHGMPKGEKKALTEIAEIHDVIDCINFTLSTRKNIVTPQEIAGFENMWRQANDVPFPFLFYIV